MGEEEAILVRICNECAAELPQDARFCPSCGADAATGEARGETAEAGGESVGEMLAGFASGTADEIKRTTAPILKSETSRKVAAGAAIGAIAAVAVPFVSVGLGAVIGAGIAALRRRSS
jgi:hypothetical protein